MFSFFKNRRFIEFIIFNVLGLFFVFGIVFYLDRENLTTEEFGAIYGGEMAPESLHPYVGYLAKYKEESPGVYSELGVACTVTFLSKDTVVTAAHCIQSSFDYFVGLGVISDVGIQEVFENPDYEKHKVIERKFHPDWKYSGQDTIDYLKSSTDMVILRTETEASLEEFAEIVEAKEINCGTDTKDTKYLELGYGRSDLETIGERKKAGVCLSQFSHLEKGDGNVIETVANACFGDSGGPIMIAGTNKIIAILSTIRVAQGADCKVDNSANFYNLGREKSVVEGLVGGVLPTTSPSPSVTVATPVATTPVDTTPVATTPIDTTPVATTPAVSTPTGTTLTPSVAPTATLVVSSLTPAPTGTPSALSIVDLDENSCRSIDDFIVFRDNYDDDTPADELEYYSDGKLKGDYDLDGETDIDDFLTFSRGWKDTQVSDKC